MTAYSGLSLGFARKSASIGISWSGSEELASIEGGAYTARFANMRSTTPFWLTKVQRLWVAGNSNGPAAGQPSFQGYRGPSLASM